MDGHSDSLKQAIRQQDLAAVRAWLKRARQVGSDNRQDPVPVDLAVQRRHLPILAEVLSYILPACWARGYARALEEGWEEGLQVMDSRFQSDPSVLTTRNRISALAEAGWNGWLHAVDRLLTAHPHLLSMNTDQSPLSAAIRAHQIPAVHRMLQAAVNPSLLDGALRVAVMEGPKELLPTLWPLAQNIERVSSLLNMVMHSREEALAWTQAHLSPNLDELRVDWERMKDTWGMGNRTQELLIEGIKQGRTGLVMRLLPLVDPQADQSRLLRTAVEQGKASLVDQLLPVSNPQAARNAWLKKKPPRWTLVDRLGLHLSPDQQADWLNRPERMPQLTAARRAQQATQVTPTRSRHRWRS